MIRHFAGIPARLVTHRLLVQILQTPDTKATIMTLVKNVDDTKIRSLFSQDAGPSLILSSQSVLLSLS